LEVIRFCFHQHRVSEQETNLSLSGICIQNTAMQYSFIIPAIMASLSLLSFVQATPVPCEPVSCRSIAFQQYHHVETLADTFS
jgi:hypothetical protein